MSTKLKITDKASLKYINNQHQLDIAYAAMVHVSYGSKLLRYLIKKLIKYWSNRCDKFIDKDWIDSHSGLIAGDWKHFKTHEENIDGNSQEDNK